ncbi:MAG: VOC family protein [Novosphingobium sp.]|jgi:catechol 2,3-dioxygenase-like lactoylglutathione lyase family enzyme|nr:VOC family protein [Novosphingobium sp.]
MLSHFTIGSSDLERSGCFYDAVLTRIGLVRRPVTPDGGPAALCWVSKDHPLPRFYVYEPYNGLPATAGNGVMLAFSSPDRNAVDLAYAAGIEAGGTCEGPPGERPRYGSGYYGAYLRDPDGNKIHVVYRGDIHA